MYTHRLMTAAATCGLLALTAPDALAHDGRRFSIEVRDGQLVAQGYISGTAAVDDGGGLVRPYVNALHGHWSTPSAAVDFSFATLPGYDVQPDAAALLAGGSLTYELIGGLVLTDPAAALPDTGHGGHQGTQNHQTPVHSGDVAEPPTPIASSERPLDLRRLSADQAVTVSYGNAAVSTDAPGELVLSAALGGGGLLDIDLSYHVAQQPINEIYVLESLLHTTATDASGAAIRSSETVYTLLAPDPSFTRGFHAQTIALEAALAGGASGASIPEPATAVLLLLGGGVLLRRRC